MTLWTDLGISAFEMDAVLIEGANQVKKWGIQCEDPHKWLGWLSEEMGELAKAVNKVYSKYDKEDIDRQDVFQEAIQTATLALKIARMYRSEQLDLLDRALNS